MGSPGAIIAFDVEGSRNPHCDMVAVGFSACTVAAEPVVLWSETFVLKPRDPSAAAYTIDENCLREFWRRPEMAGKLEAYFARGERPEIAIPRIVAKLRALLSGTMPVELVCDSPYDVQCLNVYLGQYSPGVELSVISGTFRDPAIADAEYRGDLGTRAQWGLNERIAKKYGFEPAPNRDPHNPECDAEQIGLDFARYLHAKTAK